MQIYKELKPVSREWFPGCLIIELGPDQYVYVNRGNQVESLTKATFDLTKPDLEPINQEQAIQLVPAIAMYLENPVIPVLALRLG